MPLSSQRLALHYGLRLDASEAFIQGYVDGMRLDQRGQGVACGRGWIPRSKKCSRDKASQTSKEAKAKTVERAKERAKLKSEVKAAKGQKPRVKGKNSGAIAFDLDAKPLKTKAELEAHANDMSKDLKGRKVEFQSEDGSVTYRATLNGAKVADIGGGRRFVVADIGEYERIGRNGAVRRGRNLTDSNLSRDFYTAAAGLPKDSLVGGKTTATKNTSGTVWATTSSGQAISASPGRKVTIDLGRQAVDYPLKRKSR
jgi:cytochrome oxidase assembly protein ShyY1